MLSALLSIALFTTASFAAQSAPTVICVAGQCLQGLTNVTTGATLSASGAPVSLILLPGQYTSSTNPALLHDMITSSTASIASSPGFDANLSLPLNLALQPGLASYADPRFAGEAAFAQLPSVPSNSSAPLSAGSFALSSNVWVALAGSSSDRIVFWDSVPDVSQLPSGASSLSRLLDIQSSACSPPCAGAGVCSASGTCSCPPGFNGTSCEQCSPGFFGPKCTRCPDGCASCDDGISGSGRCLVPLVSNPPSSCNCLNGVCESNGQCTCNAGWTAGTNGTACSKCADGFFQDSTGNCQVCNLGCNKCADGSGECISCKSGFTQNANDRKSCIGSQATTSTGTICPDGSFSDGTTCKPCSPLCQTCSGPNSSDCIICGVAKYTLGGNCVGTDGNGVCAGSKLVANNNKHTCDTCPSKCTSCKFPNFNVATTIDQVQCTGCLPGFVLSQGKCVDKCPAGTFLDPQDNLTCTTCDSSCSSCAGSATFCLTCANNQLASNGKCVTTCPADSFSSAGTCNTCHPDCATCSGTAFNQCSSCPPDRPVLTNGRCLPTCSKSQFFDKTSSTCQSCDASCSSCTGSGPSNCLACANSGQVLKAGTCVSASCGSSSSVVPGLGICLSDLVAVPPSNGSAPPTVPGLNNPVPTTNTVRRPLEWWQILLMALGCAFIFVVILMCWRRRMRKRRAAATAAFASAKKLNRHGWRHRLVRFGERLFGHKQGQRWMMTSDDNEAIRMDKLRAAEEARYTGDIKRTKSRTAESARYSHDMDKLLNSYEYSRAGSSRQPSPLPSLRSYNDDKHSLKKAHELDRRADTDALSRDSLYSQVTGMPRNAPEPRQPVKNPRDLLPSRFSDTTYSSWVVPDAPSSHPPPMAPTPAQEYARTVTSTPQPQEPPLRGAYWLQPTNTGSSNNPFLR